MDYYPPSFKHRQFNCVHCGVYSSQYWVQLRNTITNPPEVTDFYCCKCGHCGKLSIWHNENILFPQASQIVEAHHDMPDDCKIDFNEARLVYSSSPRASAALLRLLLQKLLKYLGAKGENINNDIQFLVKNGLPIDVQKAFAKWIRPDDLVQVTEGPATQ